MPHHVKELCSFWVEYVNRWLQQGIIWKYIQNCDKINEPDDPLEADRTTLNLLTEKVSTKDAVPRLHLLWLKSCMECREELSIDQQKRSCVACSFSSMILPEVRMWAWLIARMSIGTCWIPLQAIQILTYKTIERY